jgi:hypothetical protein
MWYFNTKQIIVFIIAIIAIICSFMFLPDMPYKIAGAIISFVLARILIDHYDHPSHYDDMYPYGYD